MKRHLLYKCIYIIEDASKNDCSSDVQTASNGTVHHGNLAPTKPDGHIKQRNRRKNQMSCGKCGKKTKKKAAKKKPAKKKPAKKKATKKKPAKKKPAKKKATKKKKKK